MSTNSFIGILLLVGISICTVYFFATSRYSDVSLVPDKNTKLLKHAKNLFLSAVSRSVDNNTHQALRTALLRTATPGPSHKDRLAIIAYIPNSLDQAYQFLVLLFGSWKYIVDHQRELFKEEEVFNSVNDLDLLAFCHPQICKEIQHVCTKIKSVSEITTTTQQRCWAIEQTFEIDIPYGPLNSFIMFNRSDITELLPRYKYTLRTDNDVFISPAMFYLKPLRFLHGHGGYSDKFNMDRLKGIAKKLKMVHRGRHAIGSTWCGKTDFFLKVAKKTLEITRYVWLNEFDPSAPGLETINFKANRDGEWIRWWRPVSLLYGGELVLNHMIEDLSDKNKGNFDSSSCDSMSIWKTPHIHCWHNDCEFQKFKFEKYLKIAISGKANLPGEVVHRIVENTYAHDISKLGLKDYSTFIAWNSVSKYLRKWFT